MILRNCDIDTFAERISGKKLVCFGAYVMPIALCNEFEEYNFEDKIAYLVDNDVKKHNTDYDINGRLKKIYSVEKFAEIADEDTVLLITSMYYADIIEQLDSYSELDDLQCYIYPIMKSFQKSKGVINVRNSNEMLIPKKIHYFWFGGNPKSDLINRCIESWRKFCPDYEIIEWNESNYDVNKNSFMKNAYQAKKYAFVSDYARIDIVNQYGGIYMDTDVEIIRSIDDLLYNKAYFGFGSYGRIASGLGFGSVKNNAFLKEMLDMYKFDNFNVFGVTKTNTMRETEFFVKKGLKPDNKLQIIDENIFLPSEFFDPKVPGTDVINKTENTYTIHHSGFSWASEEEYNSYKESIKRQNKIIERCKKSESI